MNDADGEDGRFWRRARDQAVAWLHTTRLFQRISGCLDPRRGRGTFRTFHADYPMFRCPLGHVFHETSFTLVRPERLPHIGSDHFPVLAELCYEPAAEARQVAREMAREDLEGAQEKIVEGRRAARDLIREPSGGRFAREP